MTLFFEISLVVILASAALIYTSDVLYWIYKDLKEVEEEEKEKNEEEEMKEKIIKTMYS